MSYQSVTSTKRFDYKKLKKGEVLVEGRYLGTTKNMKYDNNDFLFKPNDGGMTVHLWGSGHLAWGLSSVNVGQDVRVTYMGTEKLTEGKFKGKDSHQFDVAVKVEEATAERMVEAAPEKTESVQETGTVNLSDLD